MPNRHGALVRSKDGPRCRLGIWQVFDPWVHPNLLAMQGHNIRHPEDRPLHIEYHFRRVVIRLVRSLGRLYQYARQYDRFLEAGGLAGPDPVLVFEIPEEAGIAADSVFHYLTLFIDDLARIIPFVLIEDGDEHKEPDGFGELKKQLIEGRLQASQAVIDLFVALDQDNSWWSLGFKRGIGMRQRLTHYTDLVYFRGSGISLSPLEVRPEWSISRPLCRISSQAFVNGLINLIRYFSHNFRRGWQDKGFIGNLSMSLFLP